MAGAGPAEGAVTGHVLSCGTRGPEIQAVQHVPAVPSAQAVVAQSRLDPMLLLGVTMGTRLLAGQGRTRGS